MGGKDEPFVEANEIEGRRASFTCGKGRRKLKGIRRPKVVNSQETGRRLPDPVCRLDFLPRRSDLFEPRHCRRDSIGREVSCSFEPGEGRYAFDSCPPPGKKDRIIPIKRNERRCCRFFQKKGDDC